MATADTYSGLGTIDAPNIIFELHDGENIDPDTSHSFDCLDKHVLSFHLTTVIQDTATYKQLRQIVLVFPKQSILTGPHESPLEIGPSPAVGLALSITVNSSVTACST